MSDTDVFVSANGIKTTAKWDADGVSIKTEQRVDPIIDEFRNLSAMGHNPKAAGRLAASVPLHIHNQWVEEWRRTKSDTCELKVFLAAKINSLEGAPFRNQKIRG